MNSTTIGVLGIGVLILAGIFWYVTSTPMMDREREHGTGDGHADDIAAHEIAPGTVAAKMRSSEDFVLLDVRTPEEYEEVHLEGAQLLPVQELSAETLEQIGLGATARDREIIIYCRSGARSKTAYDIMNSLGYTNIKSIAGGMVHWQEDGYPFTESGPAMEMDMMGSIDKVSAAGPDISLSRTTHDFGVVPQYGGTVETTFRVENTGTQTLEIGELTTSCSCTSAEISERSIAPGGSALLTVVFDPDFHEEPLGVFKRTVFIPSNDPDEPETEVTVSVDIAEGE